MAESLPGDAHSRPPAPMRTGLDAVLRRLGAAPVDSITRLLEAWPSVVGEEIAQHCIPRRLEATTLLVEVDEPKLVSHLEWQETALLGAVRELLETEEPTRLTVVVQRS